MHHGHGQQLIETPVVAALGCRAIDFEQGIDFRPADRLVLHGCRCEDTRAPRHVFGIERAGKMRRAFGGRALTGDDAVAHDCECNCGGSPVGNL